VARKWISVYTIIILSALVLTALIQYSFQHFSLNGKDELSPFISSSIILVAMLLLILCIVINYRLIKKLLNKL
jgi:amino acid transporter